MKPVILGSALLMTMVACEDATSPRGIAPFDASRAGGATEDVTIAATSHPFAVVNMGGGLVRGNQVSATTYLGPGQYEVTFNRDVSQCAYIATTANAYSQAVQAFAAGGHLNANGVFVETKNQGGGLTDAPFHLVVSCGDAGIPFAVVDYTGGLVRGSAGTSLTPLGFGRYEVTFSSNISACAYVATVADPGNALVFSPSGVYTASHVNSNTVYVETKNPGGGLQDGVPFHLAVVCPNVAQTRFAVVKANGMLQRGNATTTSGRPSTGNYTVTTNRNVASTCAAVATRGSIGPAVPFSPATVEITPGPGPTSIGVQVRSLLFFGGGLANQPFHAALVCA
ncbi:MAG: hypothetical protein ACT4P7_10235 [Gemmatimonadaceae bacterium]